MVPPLPSVTIFSATERAALALASVVVTRLCLIRLQTRLASIALRCSPVRPSFAVRFRWRILQSNCLPRQRGDFFFRSLEQVGLEGHPEREARAASFSLISFSDFFPKLRYLSISCSVFIAN